MTESRMAYNSCDPHRMLVLSLKPRFAEAILSGNKAVELRRVEPRITVPTRALIYASTPIRSLVGQCVVYEVLRLPLQELWRRFGTDAALSYREYQDYFTGTDTGVALRLSNPTRLSAPIPLSKLQQSVDRFRAPQSFAYLATEAGARLLAIAS